MEQRYETQTVFLPTETNGVNSAEFQPPAEAEHMIVHVPALIGTGATLKLQARNPITDVFADILFITIDQGDDATAPVAAKTAAPVLVESTVVVVPRRVYGGGPLRFVASEAQTGAVDAIAVPVTYPVPRR